MSTETTHVIFDLDGVIINTIDVVMDVLREYAKSYGKEVPDETERKVANIQNTTLFFNEYLDYLGFSEDESLRDGVRKQLIRMIFSQKFELIPGVERLVKHLHRHKIPMAVATGNTNRHYGVVSRDFQDFFNKYFSHVVCGWDDIEVIKKKPNPDVYIVCANRFQTKPKDKQNVLIVEDSLTGITGAVASEMKTLLINDRKWCDFKPIIDKINLVCDSYHDFKPQTIGLPAYES